jgi:hypothetical protein
MIHFNFARVISFFYFLFKQEGNKSFDAFRVRELSVLGESEILNATICSSFDVHSYTKLLYVDLLTIILHDCVFSYYRNHTKRLQPMPYKAIALTLIGLLLGLATVLLLPFLFLVWYDAYWRRHEVEAHLSAAMPSPAEADNIPESILPESIKPALDEAPLPPAFQRWIDGRQNK